MREFFRALLRFFREADIFLLVISLVSAIYGILLITSVTKNLPSGGSEVNVQIGALVIGLILFVLFSYIDIDIIADKSWFLFVFSLLFISTLFFWGMGSEEVGNRAWLRFFGIGIQPAEVVKITFIIIIAKMITNHKERKSLNNTVSILQMFLVFAAIFGLIILVSADLGSALVYVFIMATMLFVGGLKLRWFAGVITILAAVSPLIWFRFLTQGQRNRIQAPFMPDVVDPDRLNVLWQPDMSVSAISSGGFRGQGLGKGRMTQAGLIPEQRTDFIFSAAGEELGFIGCMFIVLLLLAVIIRCVYIGIKSNNTLGFLVCAGIAAMFISQMLENIGMCLGILPVIGITLPFFSYGGSSLVTSLAAMGIVSGIKMRPKPVRFRSL